MSSYNEPLPVGDPGATGATAIAIGNTPAGVNNNGNATDSAGNLRVDFVWGSRPAQPNDERADGTPTATETYGASQNGQWTTKSAIPSARLNAALGNHSDIEAEWANFPSFVEAAGNYKVTDASGDGTTVTYTSQNYLAAGDVVNITGLTTSAYNLSGVTVASADKLKFTVTNAANAGLITGQWYGKVEKTTARSAADGAGIPYIVVPSVVGDTLANALDELKDAGYEAANITTASAATNAAKTVTAAARSNGSNLLVFTASGAGAAYGVGNKVTVSAFTGGNAVLNGTYTVVDNATNTFTVQTTATTAVSLSAQTASVVGVAGTIKSQTVAAGTASVLSTATISITPFATAS